MAKKFKARVFQMWLDSLASNVIKFRDGYKCQIGQKCNGQVITDPYDCQWVHIYGRLSKYVKWDAIDAVCGCGACHRWGHDNPEEFIKWFKKKYPARYEYLNEPVNGVPRRSVTLGSWKEDDYLAIEKKLLVLALNIKMPYERLPERWKSVV